MASQQYASVSVSGCILFFICPSHFLLSRFLTWRKQNASTCHISNPATLSHGFSHLPLLPCFEICLSECKGCWAHMGWKCSCHCLMLCFILWLKNYTSRSGDLSATRRFCYCNATTLMILLIRTLKCLLLIRSRILNLNSKIISYFSSTDWSLSCAAYVKSQCQSCCLVCGLFDCPL